MITPEILTVQTILLKLCNNSVISHDYISIYSYITLMWTVSALESQVTTALLTELVHYIYTPQHINTYK